MKLQEQNSIPIIRTRFGDGWELIGKKDIISE